MILPQHESVCYHRQFHSGIATNDPTVMLCKPRIWKRVVPFCYPSGCKNRVLDVDVPQTRCCHLTDSCLLFFITCRLHSRDAVMHDCRPTNALLDQRRVSFLRKLPLSGSFCPCYISCPAHSASRVSIDRHMPNTRERVWEEMTTDSRKDCCR